MALLVFLTVVLILSGISEYFFHQQALRKIPIRIHVNGTRGKSSVTRLIAAGLRAAGIPTCAKTTGTLPRFIVSDQKEYPIFRPSRPNVIEQLKIVKLAGEVQARALVAECMALQPFLQWLSERKMIRATHGVITNIRADHLEVMGPTEEDVARAICGTVPVGGKLFTHEEKFLPLIREVTVDRGTQLIPLDKEDLAGVTQEEMARFGYVEHRENVALALKVCESFGVKRQVALAGMWRALPDPGVTTVSRLHFFGRDLVFVNAFAANDPVSTETLWNMALARYPEAEKRIALFNCRWDRPDRSKQLGESCGGWQAADHYVLVGSGTFIFASAARKKGLDMAKVSFLGDCTVQEVFESMVEIAGSKALIVGMGNIGGAGLEIVRHFRNRSVAREIL